ncbi:hypothetical protein EAI_11488 [Harpegnathos saltator]|uniref:Uncharacterized protein n=1 Tax=Harpegnathos saltator TaxID=610380 RepID=E2C3E3_HARSA|nr:hypothetical protein EAI_11488 [Harpegnathos saltator]
MYTRLQYSLYGLSFLTRHVLLLTSKASSDEFSQQCFLFDNICLICARTILHLRARLHVDDDGAISDSTLNSVTLPCRNGKGDNHPSEPVGTILRK